ncbi:winged helix-turn-helix transcriptional regulator [Rhodobacterales bacterium LSUCC1028]|nr:winged helix-turn-helix transcriptional regulator [Rhodobacterales bacterium LSUCC1028]
MSGGCVLRDRIGLDATDIRILSAVQKHGQLSKTKLAELVNLSATPCWARLTRLRAAGYIKGYHADIVLDAVLDTTRVIVTLSLSRHRKADFERFEAYVLGRDEIINCVSTGGGSDYVMTVVTTSMAEFQDLMETMLQADLLIERYMTYFATRLVKAEQPNLAKLVTQARKTP